MRKACAKILISSLIAFSSLGAHGNTLEIVSQTKISGPLGGNAIPGESLTVQTRADGKINLIYETEGQRIELPQFAEVTRDQVLRKAGSGWVRPLVRAVSPIPVALCAAHLGGYLGAVTTGMHVAETHGGLTPLVWAILYGYPMGMIVGGLSGYFVPFALIPSAAKGRKAVKILSRALSSPNGSTVQSPMAIRDLIMNAGQRLKIPGLDV